MNNYFFRINVKINSKKPQLIECLLSIRVFYSGKNILKKNYTIKLVGVIIRHRNHHDENANLGINYFTINGLR